MKTHALVLGLLLAGCTESGDPPGSGDAAPLDAALPTDSGVLIDPEREMQQVFATFVRIQSALGAEVEANGQYPDLAVGFTPRDTCCSAGGAQCPPDVAPWVTSPAWSTLGITVEVPHHYVFRIDQSSPSAVNVVARGDRDCDGTPSDIVMSCAVQAAGHRCGVLFPGAPD